MKTIKNLANEGIEHFVFSERHVYKVRGGVFSGLKESNPRQRIKEEIKENSYRINESKTRRPGCCGTLMMYYKLFINCFNKS